MCLDAGSIHCRINDDARSRAVARGGGEFTHMNKKTPGAQRERKSLNSESRCD